MSEEALRKQIFWLLDGGNAHAKLEQVVASMPFEKQGVVPDGLPHSAWQVLDHLRIALEDMLEFSDNQNGTYKERKWPDDYWPSSPKPPQHTSWQDSAEQTASCIARFKQLLSDPKRDLYAEFPWGDGQSLFHEALLIADHNAYHLGAIVTIRQLLGVWPPEN